MKTKYELFCRKTGGAITVYMGNGREQELFDSVEDARKSNYHGVYEDRVLYGVRKVELKASAINLDPPSKADLKRAKEQAESQAKLDKEMDALGLKGMDRWSYSVTHEINKGFDSIFLDVLKRRSQ